MVDRRGFLVAGGAALALSACGGERQPRAQEQTVTDVAADVELLNALLQVEASAIAFYARGGHATLLEHERAHAARLGAAVRRLGGTPATDDAALRPASADALEQTMVAAYLDALPKLASPRLRELVAGIAAVEAEHLAAVALAQDRPAASAAFVTGGRHA